MDGDGKIDFLEFVTFIMESSMSAKPKKSGPENFTDAFIVFDSDRDGLISASDLR